LKRKGVFQKLGKSPWPLNISPFFPILEVSRMTVI
jgi:hypothetical protein